MSHPDPTDPLVALIPPIHRAIAITSPSTDERISMFEPLDPLGGLWTHTPHDEFSAKLRESFKSLVAKIRELSGEHPTHTVLVILDALTERVLQAPLASIEPLPHELDQLPCGRAIGPAGGRWWQISARSASHILNPRHCRDHPVMSTVLMPGTGVEAASTQLRATWDGNQAQHLFPMP